MLEWLIEIIIHCKSNLIKNLFYGKKKNYMILRESELYGNPGLGLLQLCSTALDEVKWGWTQGRTVSFIHHINESLFRTCYFSMSLQNIISSLYGCVLAWGAGAGRIGFRWKRKIRTLRKQFPWKLDKRAPSVMVKSQIYKKNMVLLRRG